jgi:hypothetical protein
MQRRQPVYDDSADAPSFLDSLALRVIREYPNAGRVISPEDATRHSVERLSPNTLTLPRRAWR